MTNKPVTTSELADALPDGSEITYVSVKGKQVINIKTPRWQTAVRLVDDRAALIDAIIDGAWSEEAQIEHLKRLRQARKEYNANRNIAAIWPAQLHIDGPPPKDVQLSGPDGGNIPIVVVNAPLDEL